MSIPPSDNRRPSSTPPGKSGSSETQDDQKPFTLPGRKEKVLGKEEEPKKKGLFDLTMEDVGIKSKQQALEEGAEAAVETASGSISSTTAVAQVQQIGQLIQKMVSTMAVGQMGGKDFASLNLKESPEVPQAFAGSNLTISYEANNLTIHFDNFMSPQQQNNAITLVEQNKEQLLQMVEALNAKNVQITELSIGNHLIAVPQPEGLPPPFQPITTEESERAREQRGQRDHREGDQSNHRGPR